MFDMTSLQSFLRCNHLRQVDIVRYLGISRPYMSQLVSGSARMSPEKMNRLLNNDKGWNVSMLVAEVEERMNEQPEIVILREKVKYLEQMLKERKIDNRIDET